MTRARDIASGLGPEAGEGKPHIIPDVLYPAVAGKLLDGTTSHSGDYGTAQSDSRKYYYTDIKGSKPIRDPRVGGHFGSQRHKFKSTQLLEQETATHGSNVYSIDGREWCRANLLSQGNAFNDLMGNYFSLWRSTAGYFEVVGYFIDINIILRTNSSALSFKHNIDGGSYTTKSSIISVESPLGSRFVDSGSVYNLGLSESLGIHTLRLENVAAQDVELFGIELIAQDTTSTANRSKIQIPSQDVVSYGKKFTVSGTPHYDPFTTMSYGGSGTTLSALQSLIDTDTSLGMDAWKAGTSNYHRPWNGGRIIKWVDSSGTIKTSVNMMPPNAQNIGTTASNAVSDAHVIAGTNDDTINFNTSAIDHTQAEVAKTYFVREFGNGSANGNATYADASMLTASTDDIAYVMDDGLTSLSAKDVQIASTPLGLHLQATDDTFYVTFIGTGLTIVNNTDFADGGNNQMVKYNLVQNLPFGTHILEVKRTSTYTSSTIKIDGVQIHTGWIRLEEVTFHQPKKPPIPEDAVVLCDYMLMADFVPNTSFGRDKISKGVREVDSSRDVFYDTNGSFTSANLGPDGWRGLRVYNNSGTADYKLPFFGNGVIFRSQSYTDRVDDAVFKINSDVYDTNFNSAGNYSASNRVGCTSPNPWDTSNNDGTFTFRHSSNGNNVPEGVGVKNLQLGLNELHIDSPQYVLVADAIEVASPIHTSFHYQTFETPFLHELIGGDRNMEQTNLVCSPDGKSWDQITRDTSYIGNIVLTSQSEQNAWITADTTTSTVTALDKLRGSANLLNAGNKDWAIAYDRYICLVDGFYEFRYQGLTIGSSDEVGHRYIKINGSTIFTAHRPSTSSSDYDTFNHAMTHFFKRGDYIQMYGRSHGDVWGNFQIRRV